MQISTATIHIDHSYHVHQSNARILAALLNGTHLYFASEFSIIKSHFLRIALEAHIIVCRNKSRSEQSTLRFLIRLANAGQYFPRDKKHLSTQAFDAVRVLGADVGNLRVSTTAVELDLLLDTEADLEKAVKALEDRFGSVLTLRRLDVESAPMEKAEAIKLGIDLFNLERYWESHEALELAWRKAWGPEKEILQGIILLAVALVHWQKNERTIALSVMKRAYDKLAAHHDAYFGIDLNVLKNRVNQILANGQPEFFRIEVK